MFLELNFLYAVTVHRVQRSTLKKTHLYLNTSIFCEGQTYVALSRVKNSDSVHILKFEKCAFYLGKIWEKLDVLGGPRA